MSKNKKKQKKRISPETADRLKTGFGTLISNDAVIKASREWKGIIDILPIGLALASVVLAVLPTLVSRMNVQGSTAVFATPVAGYDQGLAQFENALIYDESGNERELVLTIGEDGTYHFAKEDRIALTGGEEKWYTVTHASTKAPVFEVFFNTTSLSDWDFYSLLDKNKNPYTQAPRDTSADAKEEYRASYLAFGKGTIRFRKRSESGTLFAGLTGYYDRLAGTNFTELAKQLKADNLQFTSKEYLKRVRDFYANVVTQSFETEKIKSAWSYTGIFAAIDLGLIVLFGIILFLMTRGKKNPFRVYTFWETQKMAYWASFAPAILSMAVGFWLVQYAFILFMFAYGMRMMWMSMRSLRPVQK